MRELMEHTLYGKTVYKVDAFDDGIDITKDDFVNIFNDRKFIEEESFFVIENDTHEITTRHGEDYKEDAIRLKQAFNAGNTILLKRLHDVLPKFKSIAHHFDEDANTYILIAPSEGGSFDWHKDDRHVYLRMLYGEKIMHYRENGEEKFVHLTKGDWAFIPMGIEHKAQNLSACITMTVGIMENKEWKVKTAIDREDLDREFPDFK